MILYETFRNLVHNLLKPDYNYMVESSFLKKIYFNELSRICDI